ncbi:hypothetical protein PRIC2_014573 [Phytophthora ramorum]|uniref:uncharacterized protein n=1 Tax=Phytophthora ramorum TaxID=164328 RepID=UPI0030A64CF8|nr:hypothetical protein KRP23_262 [Phytophthora ramorum]
MAALQTKRKSVQYKTTNSQLRDPWHLLNCLRLHGETSSQKPSDLLLNWTERSRCSVKFVVRGQPIEAESKT